MTSSWDAYYVVFLSALLALVIPIVFSPMLPLFFRRRNRQMPRQKSQDSDLRRTVLGERINVRYFLAANAGLVLFALALELIPCVIAQQQNRFSPKGILAVVSIAGFAILGLLYAVRKGDMSWLSALSEKTVNRDVRSNHSSKGSSESVSPSHQTSEEGGS